MRQPYLKQKPPIGVLRLSEQRRTETAEDEARVSRETIAETSVHYATHVGRGWTEACQEVVKADWGMKRPAGARRYFWMRLSALL